MDASGQFSAQKRLITRWEICVGRAVKDRSRILRIDSSVMVLFTAPPACIFGAHMRDSKYRRPPGAPSLLQDVHRPGDHEDPDNY